MNIDVRLDEVVLKALEKEPERRYQQASKVKTDVETIAAHRLTARQRCAGSSQSPAYTRPRRGTSRPRGRDLTRSRGWFSRDPASAV
jgi:hypothetical protein